MFSGFGVGKETAMRYLVTSEEMRRYDYNTITKIGIPGMVLMERAALAVLEQIEGCPGKQHGLQAATAIGKKEKRGVTIFVLAGMGNNGGDGLALARLLAEKGYSVEVGCIGREEKASEQWKVQREILKNYPVKVGTEIPEKEYTILVDALFGVGLSREVEGSYAEAIEALNEKCGYKIAVDVPSGLDADTGKVLGVCVKADVTVTFGFCKRGLVLYPGCEYAGRVITAPIGITEYSFFEEKPRMFYYTEKLKDLLPPRAGSGNKGTFGKVLLVAGSQNMAGAAILAAKAAYRAGAGMVKVITPPENRVILQESVPEALPCTADELADGLQWADVAVIGPGLSKGEDAMNCLRHLIEKCSHPLVIDADGLNLLSEDEELMGALARREADTVLTPHVGELSRLTGSTIGELKEDLPKHAMKLAEKQHAVVVAKDARSFVCRENMPVCVNLTGNSGMATAGSGDVLAGIIGALLAQGMDAFGAASVGAYAHGMAGNLAAERLSEYGVMAGDIAEKIGDLV